MFLDSARERQDRHNRKIYAPSSSPLALGAVASAGKQHDDGDTDPTRLPNA
jgi:hypothetical protein